MRLSLFAFIWPKSPRIKGFRKHLWLLCSLGTQGANLGWSPGDQGHGHWAGCWRRDCCGSAQPRRRKEVETVGDVMEQNMRFGHTGEVTGMMVLKGTSLTNQPFFIGWYNSGWVSSRKENNKNKIAQKEIKKENGFHISYFRTPL